MAFERQMPDNLMVRDARLFGSVLERHRLEDPPSVHWARWAAAGIALVMIVSFCVTRHVSRKRASIKIAPSAAQVPSVAAPGATNAVAWRLPGQTSKPSDKAKTPPPAPSKPPSAAALQAKRWLDGAANRSREERILLERLAQAEREGNMRIAIDSIEQLRKRPTMADIDDALARRLGALNVDYILSGQPTLWTAEVELRGNDTPYLVARRYRTTVEAIRRLNNLAETHAFPLSMKKARVLEFPRASLVVRQKMHVADFTLNGKFFKRFYVSTSADTKPGAYPIGRGKGEGPLERFKALGLRFAPVDEAELRMFLAPGAQLTVSDL